MMAMKAIVRLILIIAWVTPQCFCFTFCRKLLTSFNSKVPSHRSYKFCDAFESPPVTALNRVKLFSGESEKDAVDMDDVGFVLLAGGTGSRMQANIPKQFMILRGKAVLQHSLDLFLKTLPAFLDQKGTT